MFVASKAATHTRNYLKLHKNRVHAASWLGSFRNNIMIITLAIKTLNFMGSTQEALEQKEGTTCSRNSVMAALGISSSQKKQSGGMVDFKCCGCAVEQWGGGRCALCKNVCVCAVD